MAFEDTSDPFEVVSPSCTPEALSFLTPFVRNIKRGEVQKVEGFKRSKKSIGEIKYLIQFIVLRDFLLNGHPRLNN